MAKRIEATITISGWGEDEKQAIAMLCFEMGKVCGELNKGTLPVDLGIKFSEFDETANYVGMYKECQKCQYKLMGTMNGCNWIPATDPTGCEVENKKEKV